jgi:hypothetical protein
LVPPSCEIEWRERGRESLGSMEDLMHLSFLSAPVYRQCVCVVLGCVCVCVCVLIECVQHAVCGLKRVVVFSILISLASYRLQNSDTKRLCGVYCQHSLAHQKPGQVPLFCELSAMAALYMAFRTNEAYYVLRTGSVARRVPRRVS